MASVVRTAQGEDTASAVTTLAMAVPAAGYAAGHTLIILVGWRAAGTAAAISGVADNHAATTNVYQTDKTSASSTTDGIAICSCYLTTALVSGDTITVTFSVNVNAREWLIAEVAGLASSGWVDGTPPGATLNTVSPVSCPTLTPSTGPRFLVGAQFDLANITVSSVASGWTQLGTRQQGAGPQGIQGIYDDVTGNGVTTFTGQISYSGTATNGRQIAVSYNEAGAAPGFVPKTVGYWSA